MSQSYNGVLHHVSRPDYAKMMFLKVTHKHLSSTLFFWRGRGVVLFIVDMYPGVIKGILTDVQEARTAPILFYCDLF